MDTEQETSTDQPKKRWFIALDWYQQNNRSLFVLAQSYLCPKCAKEMGEEGQEFTSHAPSFITDQVPILESIFRLFLATDNQPLDLEELGKQLGEWRGGDTYRTSPEILSRLLDNDHYYGLQEATE